MKKFFFLLLTTILLIGCQSKPVNGETVTADGGSYQSVTAAELHTMLKDKDFVFVNVHIPLAGNIADTDLSIPYDQIDENLSQLPSDKTRCALLSQWAYSQIRRSLFCTQHLGSQGGWWRKRPDMKSNNRRWK
jgi:hypothetical protein